MIPTDFYLFDGVSKNNVVNYDIIIFFIDIITFFDFLINELEYILLIPKNFTFFRGNESRMELRKMQITKKQRKQGDSESNRKNDEEKKRE